jgi:3-deoxy-D-manno-octulosonic acid kinase
VARQGPTYHPGVLVPEGFVELRAGRAIGWVATELAGLGLEAFWQALEPLAFAKGRGGVGTLRLLDRVAVVRPYKRGGALARLLRDRYTGPSRARAELETLAKLRAEGVPVVVPLAAVARRHHAFWRLRLCTELLPDAMPLPAFLAAHPELRRFTTEAVGIVVKLAFEAGLRHPDLHFDNLLCAARGDRVRAVLVDLDRARVKKPLTENDTDAMLVRMLRYVVRHKSRLAAVPTRSEMMRFLRALGLDEAARKAAFLRLANKLRRALSRRRWLGR